jgi:ferredoxin
MVKRGLLWCEKRDAELLFRLAPLVVGIYEAQLENMDHEFAHLFEEYMAAGGAQGIMTPSPALHRILPASGTVKIEWILPYEDVKALLKEGKVFSVRDCICRVQQDALSKRRCTFPLRNCLYFSGVERAPKPADISRDKALSILDESEKIGLVHTVSNLRTGVFYVCNCCGCCCGVLRGITDWGVENSVARANYFAVIDDRLCTQCGLCTERCQVKAISDETGQSAIDRSKCIGCGLCVSACPGEAIRLEMRPEAEKIHPPLDFAQWELMRLANRGITD